MPFLNKKPVESSDDEVTGEYDLAEIEASEEEEMVEKSPVMRFVKTQLPFLAKFLPKKTNNKSDVFEEEVTTSDATQETNLEDVNKPKAKWEEVLEKQVPALYKIIVKIKAPKKNQGVSNPSGEKKKKIKPIHIVIILGLVYLSYEEFNSEPEGTVEPTQVETTPPAPQETPAPTEPSPTEEVVDTPTEIPADVEMPTPVETPVEEPSEVTEPEPVVIEEPEPVITPTPADDENIDLDLEDVEPIVEPSEEEVPVETPVETTIETPSDIVDEPTPQVETIPSDIYNTDQDITSSILESLENKVKKQKVIKEEEVLEPSEAPDYDYKGRGLVYNCTGGHWACIDDESFKSCSKNYNWNSAQAKTIECYSEQVYATEEDCSRAQLLKIDSVAKTDFCN